MATTAAEAVGLIKGLAEIVKLQQTTQATQQSETKTQLHPAVTAIIRYRARSFPSDQDNSDHAHTSVSST